MNYPLVFAACAALGIGACGSITGNRNVASRLADLPPDLRGIWQTEGYGYVIDLGAEAITVYDATPDICVRNPGVGADVLDILGSGQVVFNARKTAFDITLPYEPHPIRANRQAALPTPCQTPLPDTPEASFEAFASFFKTHYAFFDLYGVDWDSTVEAARARLRPDMSDAELFALMADMLRPLRDGHIELSGKVAGRQRLYEPNKGTTLVALKALAEAKGIAPETLKTRFQKAYWRDGIAGEILNGKGTRTGSGFVQYGMTSGDIGYLALVTVAGYANGDIGDPAADKAALDRIMDAALTEFAENRAKAVIIDLSVNFGGQDFIARAIAERFAAQPVTAYAKRAGDRAGGYGGARAFALRLTPHTGMRYRGPVYVMTSDVTVSGGEILTMALRALPQVVHVGMPTRGALSDVLEKTLPNGWEIALSNEIYTDHAGILWEGRGITPEIQIPVFDPQNPLTGHVAAVERLTRMIDKAHD